MLLQIYSLPAAIAALLLLLTAVGLAQQENLITDTQRGLEFVIPAGWMGQQTHEGYAFGSETIPGVLVVLYHDYNDVNALSEAAKEGLHDDEGTSLSVDGDIAHFGSNGIQTKFAGTVQGQPAKAYAVGLVSPHGGGGITILAAAANNVYSSEHKKAVETLAKSVVFAMAATGATPSTEGGNSVDEWKTWLAGMKLTYMSSYNSGGGSGGYSDKEVIDLCPDGSFGFSSRSSMTINTDGGGGAYSHGKGGGAGRWTVSGPQGQAQLELRYHSGETSTYALEYKDNKLYLNGYRYFRTNDAACH